MRAISIRLTVMVLLGAGLVATLWLSTAAAAESMLLLDPLEDVESEEPHPLQTTATHKNDTASHRRIMQIPT